MIIKVKTMIIFYIALKTIYIFESALHYNEFVVYSCF